MMDRSDKVLILFLILSLIGNIFWYQKRKPNAQKKVSSKVEAPIIACGPNRLATQSQCICPSMGNGLQSTSIADADDYAVDPILTAQKNELTKRRKACMNQAKKAELEKEKPESQLNEQEKRDRLRTLCWVFKDEESCKAMLKLEQKLCQEEGEDSWYCMSVAYAYLYGRPGIEKNVELGRSLLEQNCHERKSEIACLSLGRTYLRDDSTPQDREKGIRLHQEACNQESHYQWCGGLAELYEDGTMGAPNESKAYELYQLSCEGGNAYACFNMARYLRKGGFGTTEDAAKLDQRMINSCKSSQDFFACRWLAEQYGAMQGYSP